MRIHEDPELNDFDFGEPEPPPEMDIDEAMAMATDGDDHQVPDEPPSPPEPEDNESIEEPQPQPEARKPEARPIADRAAERKQPAFLVNHNQAPSTRSVDDEEEVGHRKDDGHLASAQLMEQARMRANAGGKEIAEMASDLPSNVLVQVLAKVSALEAKFDLLLESVASLQKQIQGSRLDCRDTKTTIAQVRRENGRQDELLEKLIQIADWTAVRVANYEAAIENQNRSLNEFMAQSQSLGTGGNESGSGGEKPKANLSLRNDLPNRPGSGWRPIQQGAQKTNNK